jgi:GT2 family glycosyltransferase
MKLSIIIVNYKVKERLFACLKSIYESKPKTEFEIIVVDNDQKTQIKNELLRIFSKVKYIKSSKNIGYGGGNNLGAKYAKGEYLFFINPDTLLFKNTVNALYEFLDVNPKAGIVAPLLVDKEDKPFNLQGTGILTPVKALIVLSFLNKLFPNNPVSKKFWLKDWNHQTLREVEGCPGTALMIRRDLFNQVGGFDENFFLYFEEDDLSKRVREKGYKIYITPESKIFHEVGASTKQFKNIKNIFSQSRFKYFRKNYGVLKALLVEIFLRITKVSLVMLLILTLALFLRVYNLSNSMVFIGDQGWFYLSARDLLINGKIPLVGITSSHTWLHQGPLWTYMLSLPLLLFKFNPISGAYLTAAFGALTAFLMYKLGEEMFSQRIGIIAALLYATSPLIIFFDRMPFDPSPIPFFTMIYFYALYKWVRGNIKYFPIVLLALAVLYNLELATFTLVFPLVFIFAYGCLKKKNWIRELLNKKIISLSLILPILIMLPVIIYDFSHGFKQTVVFLGWTIYKPFSFLIKHSDTTLVQSFPAVMNFIFVNLQKLIFPGNLIVAAVLFIVGIIVLIYQVFKSRQLEDSKTLLLLLLVISLIGIIINQTPSDAYLPIIFPFIIFSIAILFERMFSVKYLKYFSIALLIVVLALNFYTSFNLSQGTELKDRILAVNKIIALSGGQEYNLVGKGKGSQFKSFTMNYEYLLWWKGYPPSDKNVNLKIFVSESPKRFIVRKNND